MTKPNIFGTVFTPLISYFFALTDDVKTLNMVTARKLEVDDGFRKPKHETISCFIRYFIDLKPKKNKKTYIIFCQILSAKFLWLLYQNIVG